MSIKVIFFCITGTNSCERRAQIRDRLAWGTNKKNRKSPTWLESAVLDVGDLNILIGWPATDEVTMLLIGLPDCTSLIICGCPANKIEGYDVAVRPPSSYENPAIVQTLIALPLVPWMTQLVVLFWWVISTTLSK